MVKNYRFFEIKLPIYLTKTTLFVKNDKFLSFLK